MSSSLVHAYDCKGNGAWIDSKFLVPTPPYQPKLLQVLAANSIVQHKVDFSMLPTCLHNILTNWKDNSLCSSCGTGCEEVCSYCNQCILCCAKTRVNTWENDETSVNESTSSQSSHYWSSSEDDEESSTNGSTSSLASSPQSSYQSSSSENSRESF